MNIKALGEKLTIYRDRAGFSMEALAAESGVAKNAILAIEKGRTNPTIGTLSALCKPLKIKITDLFPPNEEAKVERIGDLSPFELEKLIQDSIAPRASKDERTLVRLFRKLTANDRASLLTLAESLASRKDDKLAPSRRTRP